MIDIGADLTVQQVRAAIEQVRRCGKQLERVFVAEYDPDRARLEYECWRHWLECGEWVEVIPMRGEQSGILLDSVES